jgi:hypothetical protein
MVTINHTQVIQRRYDPNAFHMGEKLALTRTHANNSKTIFLGLSLQEEHFLFLQFFFLRRILLVGHAVA